MPRLSIHARRALVQERQKQILDAAARVFAAKGFDATTIRDVARAAGVSDGSIYLYFKNKQDLLVHLPRQFIQPPLEAFQAASMRADAAPPSPDKLLTFLVQNMVTLMTHNRELMRVLFTSLPMMDEATRATYMRQVPLYAMETFETYITAQQAAGNFRADIEPAIAARVLPGMMMFFLIVQEIFQPRDLPRFEYEKIIPNVVAIFLRGVMNPESISNTVKPKTRAPKKASANISSTKTRTRRKQTIQIE